MMSAESRPRLTAKARLRFVFVLPDYYGDVPKACMDGWGRRFIVVSPDGFALPYHLAHTLPGIDFDTVRRCSLGDIWHESPGFNAFRTR